MEQPEPIADFAVVQRGRTLEMRFTLPQRATDGERLSKPLEIEIFRAITPAGQSATPSPAVLSLWQSLPAAPRGPSPAESTLVHRVILSEPELRGNWGATFTFAIRTLTRGFWRRPVESEFSNLAQVRLLDVSEPVADLRAQIEEKAIALSWSPPRRTLGGRDAAPVAGYRIYRSLTGQPESFHLQGEANSPIFHDKSFSFNQTYFYIVRTLSSEAGGVAESEDSPVISVTPRDTFPPAPPQGLTAIYAAGAVELVWTASPEADLAGYNVYRREGDQPFQKVNAEPLRTPVFRDASMVANRNYRYRVTAFDLADNESPPSEEAEVETRWEGRVP